MVISLDIAATALEAAKATVTDETRPLEGVNLDPYLRGEEEGPPHEALFWRNSSPTQTKVAVVRSGDWKLVHVNGDTPELFNMANSSPESVDVLETNRNKAAELAALWNEWNEDNFRGTLIHGIGDYEGQLKEFTDQYAEELRAAAESLPLHRIPANSAATGQPTITGNAWVGETLTVNTSGIDDADGLTNVSFSYQWLSSTVSTDTDIAGATSDSYNLVAADVGKAIRVRVSFADDRNFQETLTSEATATVTAVFTPLTAGFQDAPDSHDGTGDFTFRIEFSEPISISYVTLRDNSLDVTNGSATKAKRVNGQSDLWEITVEPDSDAVVAVVLPVTGNCAAQDAVCTRDGKKLSNRVELTVPGPEDSGQNTPATGQPTISGTAQVGETLTAETSGIADADGLNNAVYSYQWLAGDVDINGATGGSYTPVEADVGKTIKVRVSFTDDRNHQETLTSGATAAVAAKPNSPATGAPTISGTAQVGEALTAETDGISDANGLTGASFSYQWISSDTDIAGATGSTYTLAATDEGKTIKVRVSFTDGANNQETLTSAATGAVAPRPPLTATFPASPFQSARHRGTGDRPQVIVVFNRPVSSFPKTTPSASVTGGTVYSLITHSEDGLQNAWLFFLNPDGNANLQFTLLTGQACDQGGICAADGTTLSSVPATRTILGPEE